MKKTIFAVILLGLMVFSGTSVAAPPTDCGSAANFCTTGADMVEHVCLWLGGTKEECNHQWVEQYNECMGAAGCPLKILNRK